MHLDLLQPALCFRVCAAGSHQGIRRRHRDACFEARRDVAEEVVEVDRADGRAPLPLLVLDELVELGSTLEPDPPAGLGMPQVLRTLGRDELERVDQLVARRQVGSLFPLLRQNVARAERCECLLRALCDRVRSLGTSLQVLLDALGDDPVVVEDRVDRGADRFRLHGTALGRSRTRVILDDLVCGRGGRVAAATASFLWWHLRSSRAERPWPSGEARCRKKHARAEASSGPFPKARSPQRRIAFPSARLSEGRS